MNILQAEHIHKSFVNHLALFDLSIHVPQGSVFGLLGPNGAGKTTLIRIINQIYLPDNGSVFFKERKLLPEDICHIGYLPEERGLYKKMKVEEQLVYLAQLKGLTKIDALERVRFWLKEFQIDDWSSRNLADLSKGMQQKIQFISAIVHNPELIILDEPFSGFDPVNAALLKNIILRLKKEGKTIMLSTHNMSSVEEMCDFFCLINKSRKILEGKVSEIKKAYSNNSFEISIRKQKPVIFNHSVTLLKESLDNDIATYSVMLENGYSANVFISEIIREHELLYFSEILPSMEDIFIKTVSSDDRK